MQRRHTFKFIIAGIALAASAWMPAQAAAYKQLNPPQPTLGNGQIEVIEFFSYGCSHCNSFEPFLAKWRSKQAADVVFKKVPVSFGRGEWAALGRLYLTLSAMGLADKLSPDAFAAVHTEHVRLEDEKQRNAWLGKKGVDVKKFNDTWRSFSVDAQAKRSDQMAAAYKIMSVPNLVINGKYLVEGGDPAGLATVDELIAKIRSGK